MRSGCSFIVISDSQRQAVSGCSALPADHVVGAIVRRRNRRSEEYAFTRTAFLFRFTWNAVGKPEAEAGSMPTARSAGKVRCLAPSLVRKVASLRIETVTWQILTNKEDAVLVDQHGRKVNS